MPTTIATAHVTTDHRAACPVGTVPLTIHISDHEWTTFVPRNEYRDALESELCYCLLEDTDNE